MPDSRLPTVSRDFAANFFRETWSTCRFRPGYFDATASLGVIEYLKDDDGLLKEMVRVTAPNGFVLLAVTNRHSYNLMLEKPLLALRSRDLTARMLSSLKTRLRRGEFKQRAFPIRRHVPSQFLRKLEEHALRTVDCEYWGFNLLPHPAAFSLRSAFKSVSNQLYDRASFKPIRLPGEGFLVLCQKNGVPLPTEDLGRVETPDFGPLQT